MKESTPFLVRVWLALDGARAALGRGFEVVRDESLWAFTSPAGRERANRAIYARLSNYLPGGATFEEGLFDWERAALAHVPPGGRILLGAAGGGRELLPLAKMGYEVVAFEPSRTLAEAAREAASGFSRCTVANAAFSDVLSAARDASGPLASHLRGRECDAIIFGWTSFSYVWKEQREPLLKALRALAPHAPVLLSYLGPDKRPERRLGKLRSAFRFLLRMTGARSLAGPGDGFQPWSGFFQALAPEDVRALAERTGYRVEYVKVSPAPHALLVPQS